MALILGLESSCDDTAAALVSTDRAILAQAVVSQIKAHQPFGGVVPEIAARAHVEILPDLIRRVLDDAGKDIADVDAVAEARREQLPKDTREVPAVVGLRVSRSWGRVGERHVGEHAGRHPADATVDMRYVARERVRLGGRDRHRLVRVALPRAAPPPRQLRLQ